MAVFHDECDFGGKAVHLKDDRREWTGNESIVDGQRDGKCASDHAHSTVYMSVMKDVL